MWNGEILKTVYAYPIIVYAVIQVSISKKQGPLF